jgi:transposase-like protein
MSKHRKSWSQSDKTAIITHYHEQGIASTSRKFEVSSSMIYRWIREQTSATSSNTSVDIYKKEYYRLLQENQSLKELVAEKELALRIKDSLLKKTIFQNKTD